MRDGKNRVGGADNLSPRSLSPPCVSFGAGRFPGLRCYFKAAAEKKCISGFLWIPLHDGHPCLVVVDAYSRQKYLMDTTAPSSFEAEFEFADPAAKE